MAKLKLGPLTDDKPVKITVELPAQLHRDLVEYGRLLAEGGNPIEPVKLIAPMLERFIVTDRGFCEGAAGSLFPRKERILIPSYDRARAIDLARLRRRRQAGLSFLDDQIALKGNISPATGRGCVKTRFRSYVGNNTPHNSSRARIGAHR